MRCPLVEILMPNFNHVRVLLTGEEGRVISNADSDISEDTRHRAFEELLGIVTLEVFFKHLMNLLNHKQGIFIGLDDLLLHLLDLTKDVMNIVIQVMNLLCLQLPTDSSNFMKHLSREALVKANKVGKRCLTFS